jgi:predicted permease
MRRLLLRLVNVFRPHRAEPDLAREMNAHLALMQDDFERRGLTAKDARLAARRAFDGIELTKDRHRDARSFVWLDDARRDVRYAARLLVRNPTFALTVSLSLAIGIGANTTIFTIANALLFARPAGVVDPDRIVDVLGVENGRGGNIGQIAYPNYLDVRQRATTLEGVYAYQAVPQPMSLVRAIGAERITGSFVSANYFSVLGVRPAIGRLFSDADGDRPGESPIAVLSHTFWTRRLNRDPAVVGRTLTIGGQPYDVVGVAPEGFRGTSILTTDVWLPIGMANGGMRVTRAVPWPLIGGRLKAGVSRARAAAEIDAIGQSLAREFPEENHGRGLRLVAATPIPGNILPVTGFLILLTGVVSAVLAVACANVAGVLLARATARRREIAVRLAMGAGRARLVRQLLIETMLLFGLGGVAGLAIARVMTSALISRLPTLPLPVDVSLPLDGRAIAFTTGLALFAAILSGLVPALQASKADVVSALKNDAPAPFGRARMRNAFVIAQVALSILLVVGAGLLTRALQRADSVDLGFDPRGVELTSLDLSLAGYTSAAGSVFVHELLDRVRALPGVQTATVASTGSPIGDGRRNGIVKAPATFDGSWNAVDPQYFSTLKIPLAAGRDFTAADESGATPVSIVGEAAAKRFWPGRPLEDALGQYVELQFGFRDVPTPGGTEQPRRDLNPAKRLIVVGVARDVRYFGPSDTTPRVFVYVPLRQQPFGTRVTVVARSTRGQRLAAEIRELIGSMNPNLPIVSAQTLEDWTAVSLIPQRVAASVAGTLGLVGLLLAGIGIYGVTAYAVTRRTREIGVRVAMGATRTDIVWMVLRQGLSLAAVGSAIGLLLAAGASRLLTRLLFGIPPTDPVSFGGAAALFVVITLAACYMPVRRATRIDAMQALRYE